MKLCAIYLLLACKVSHMELFFKEILLNDCLQHLLSLSPVSKVLIISATGRLAIWEVFVSSMQLSLNVEANIYSNLPKFDGYVIDADFSNISNLLGSLRNSKFWNPSAKTIIFGQEVVEIFGLLWKYYLVDTVVVTDSLEVYSYEFKNARGEIGSYPMGNCRDIQVIPKHSTEKIFNGSTLNTMVYIMEPYTIDPQSESDPGYDIKIVREIFQRLNVRITYLNHSYFFWGEKTPEGKYTNVMEHLYEGRVDFIMSIQQNSSLFEDFDFTTYYSSMKLPFWTPTPEEVEQWRKIFLVFPSYVWLAIFAVILTAAIASLFFAMFETGHYKSYTFCLLNLWASMFSQDFRLPHLKSLQFLLLAWSLYNFVLTNGFQNCMITFLFRRMYHDRVRTLEELTNSRLHYGGVPPLKHWIRLQNTNITEQIYQNYEDCDFSNDCLFRVAEKADFAFITTTHILFYAVNNYPEKLLDNYGIPKMTSTEFNLGIDHSICVRKGFPLLDRFDQMILILKQSGLTMKWDIYGSCSKYEKNDRRFKKITIGHLLVAFFVLATGSTFAIVAFVHEHINYCTVLH